MSVPDWDEVSRRKEAITPLAELGMTAREIGAEVGMTKNAVVGFCKRQGIPLANRKPPKTFAPVMKKVLPGEALRASGCRYPSWGDEQPTHKYCSKSALPGRSYCAAHWELTHKAGVDVR